MCNLDLVEDEAHVINVCSMYSDLRVKLLCSRPTDNNIDLFVERMTVNGHEQRLNLAVFITDALKLREQRLI